MTRDEQRIARYEQRKVNGRCVHCNAGLDDDAESVLCVECVEKRSDSDHRYNTSERGREMRRLWQRAHSDERSDQRRARMAELRAERKRLGLCVRCGVEDARPGGSQCRPCLDRVAAWAAERRRNAQAA